MTAEETKEMEEACAKLWFAGGWGLTDREFIDLSFKEVNGQCSDAGDEVAVIKNQVLTRGMCFYFHAQWQDYCHGFSEAWRYLKGKK